MGAADSKLNVSQKPGDEITTVKDRIEGVDPSLEKLKALKIALPILKSPPTESTLTDILVRKSSSTSDSGTLNPKLAFELFSLYREWQETTAKTINEGQDELENKIDIADALATKLLQRFNHSVSVMKTSATHFEDVYPLQVEVGELKGKLKEVLADYNALCKRINAEGPDVLKASAMPFSSSELQSSKSLGCPAVQKAP
ncbi:hypothetical protein KI387_018793 [Taxus chinensis]|uniref:Uncharacterized protein n=1 Tax=Taxus chinensis TaxID=29808 RepID=A0AA38G9H6_TAXCH|nr:hypothetical protein KI387_018793 [Taxus chinensis]